MKRGLLITLTLSVLLVLCMAACAYAEDIRPLEAAHYEIDLKSGEFRLTVRDTDRIVSGGFFTASLFLEDHYDAEQIEALSPGDTVLVNGKTWTVREVIVHPADAQDPDKSFEIYTEEENDGYIVFVRADDGCFICRTNDWVPVFHVGDVRIMLPLPDRFEYRSGEEDDLLDADAFLRDLEAYGETFVAYNTSCLMEDGMLVRVAHASYPEGPAEEASDDGSEGVPVWKFCHGVQEGLDTAVITGYSIDCEAGPSPVEMTPEEVEEIRRLAVSGVVTEKASDESVTGGTWVYSFESPDGKHLLSIEMYKGLIVAVDGMYHWHR